MTPAKRRVPVSRKSSNATTKVEKLKAWSFSRLSCWENCPAQAKYKYIEKLPEVKGPPLLRGSKIHKEAELYVLNGGRLPVSLKQFRGEFKKLREDGASAEEQWAFNCKWQACDWFGAEAWLRVIVDANYFKGAEASTLVLVDYKTGKKKNVEAYQDQMELSALAGFHMYEVDRVETELWFLDSGDIVDENYKVRQIADMRKRFEKRAKRMLNDDRYPTTPNFTCRFCSFNAALGKSAVHVCKDGKEG